MSQQTDGQVDRHTQENLYISTYCTQVQVESGYRKQESEQGNNYTKVTFVLQYKSFNSNCKEIINLDQRKIQISGVLPDFLMLS